jgi:hypothetical protein
VRTLNTRALACGVGLLLSGTFLPTEASAQVTCPTFPGTQSSGCAAIITITATGATVTTVPGVGPYDGSDDTLVGVVNNIPPCTGTPLTVCGLSIYSLDLTSTNNICGFDFDGIDTYGAPSNPMDKTGYGGPNAYFSNTNPSATGCRVNFIKPLAPVPVGGTSGGTAYFSLENALTGSSACTTALNNSVTKPAGGNPQITATFSPQAGYNITQAEQLCGFVHFDWQQTVTNLPAPSPFASGCSPGTPLVAPPSFNDPPPVCGYALGHGGDAAGSAYPVAVYWNPQTELSAHTTATTLSLVDTPADWCLPGPQSATIANLANQSFSAGGCGGVGVRAPAGSVVGFKTELVGLQGTAPNFSVVPTGIFFTWTSSYNGSSGNTVATKNTKAPDPGSGTGGTTITGYNGTTTYAGVGVTAINGSPNVFGPTSLLTAALPESRSVQVNGTATAFATIINTGTNTATSCSIAPASGLPVTFVYQTTNPITNAVTGSPNTPVNIAAGGSQSFVIALTPTAAIAPTDVGFNFSCTNTTPAPIVTGLSTLLFSASTTPTPDIVALAATATNDGIVHVPGASGVGAFAVATVNLGAGASITAAANTGDASLPLTITMCQTNPTSGKCLQTPSPKVSTTINAGTTPTFAVFVAASGTVPFDPANSRVFVQFTDSTNAVRGETSVAVETQ